MKKRAGFSQSNISIRSIICIPLVIAMLAPGVYCRESQPISSEYEKNWPRFRGPGGRGISFYSNIPTSWNGKTGERVLWKTAIPLGGMSSPIVWGNRVFLTGADRQRRQVYCFDANSGELIWQRAVENIPLSKPASDDISEDTGFVASTAATDGECVYAINAYECLVAIRPRGQGDVAKTHIAWTAEGVMPDICSPVTNGDLLFVLETEGIVTCYDAGNGNKFWEKDLGKTFVASPSLVSDKVYLMAEDGTMTIIKATRQYVETGRRELGEKSKASPALHNGRIYFRGSEHLYCIAQ